MFNRSLYNNKKNFIIVFLISFFIMIISTIYETNLINIVFKYLINNEFRSNAMIEYNNHSFYESLFQLVLSTINKFEWNFNYILIWSTNIFQILLPFFAIFGSILYIENTKDNNMKTILISSLVMAIAIFFAFIIYYLLILVICNGSYSDYITRELFLDILGQNFYFDHIYLYYFLDGIIRFLFVPFIYFASGILMGQSFKNNIWSYYYIIIIYFNISLISLILIRLINYNFIYLDPITIMISGSYKKISTIMLLLVNLIPLFLSVYIYSSRRKEV